MVKKRAVLLQGNIDLAVLAFNSTQECISKMGEEGNVSTLIWEPFHTLMRQE